MVWRGLTLGAVLLAGTVGVAQEAVGGVGVARVFPLADAAGLVEHNVKAEAVQYLGRKAVRVTSADSGLAMLPGVDFQDGAIEADIALKITTPPGVRMPRSVRTAAAWP